MTALSPSPVFMMIDANGAEKQAEKLLDKLPDELMIAKI
jgi:hypothetical protein